MCWKFRDLDPLNKATRPCLAQQPLLAREVKNILVTNGIKLHQVVVAVDWHLTINMLFLSSV